MAQATIEPIVQENPERFAHPTCVFLRAYWEQKRGDRAMPARADISPAQLKDHLGWVMILEVLPGARDFRYRLIGTLVTQYFSSDSTGRTVMEAFEPSGEAVAKSVNAVFRKVARDKCVMRTTGDANWLSEGMEEFEAIYLPLSRLLSLYVAATQGLFKATQRFLMAERETKVPYIIGLAGSVAVGKSTTARVLKALLARWPNTPPAACRS